MRNCLIIFVVVIGLWLLSHAMSYILLMATLNNI